MRKTLLMCILLVSPLFAAPQRQSWIEILVDGVPRPEFFARGNIYVEALKGKEYEIRIRNPYPVRVAVALSVDGLNTIDARHTDAASARKWVLEPYETVTISGWQTSQQEAKRFYFTNESKSYGAWLGQTDNLGMISAAFFRERAPKIMWKNRQPMSENAPAGAAGAPAEPRANKDSRAESQMRRDDDLTATGIGRGVDHPVTQVYLDLEPSPAAMVNVRYEYHAGLVALGVLRDYPPHRDPMQRREQASGFCPVP
jgi:hypothetical protein